MKPTKIQILIAAQGALGTSLEEFGKATHDRERINNLLLGIVTLQFIVDDLIGEGFMPDDNDITQAQSYVRSFEGRLYGAVGER